MLNNLTKSGKNKKTIGRGGSRGGTSGRGHKGQNARSGGGVREFFEGGQMPLVRRLPKRGFSNAKFKFVYQVINLDDILKRFEGEEVITFEMLSKFCKNGCHIKILGGGAKVLDKKISIHAHAFSAKACEAIEKAGGTAKLIEEKES